MRKQRSEYQKLDEIKKEIIWKKMANISLEESIGEWIYYLPKSTGKNYLSGIRKLSRIGILSLEDSLQRFSLVNHDLILDKISKVQEWEESSKQSRAAIYISFTRFLSRKTDGLIKRASPRKDEANRTFFKVREKVKTEALSPEEWKVLIKNMELLNPRDALIAKLCLQGARRISEVLEAKISNINQEKRQILFVLNKTRGLNKHVIVTIPQSVMNDIFIHIGKRKSGYIFITAQGNKVHYTQVLRCMKKAAENSRIRKRIHTHVLRTSAITHIRSLGFQDFEIQRLTGHSSSQMLNAYDKSTLENNTSKRIFLI